MRTWGDPRDVDLAWDFRTIISQAWAFQLSPWGTWEPKSALRSPKYLLSLKNKTKQKKQVFIWLHWVLVAAWGIFSCCMWDLVPWPGIELQTLALGAWSLSHRTTTEVPQASSLERPRKESTLWEKGERKVGKERGREEEREEVKEKKILYRGRNQNC